MAAPSTAQRAERIVERPWHTLPGETILRALETSPHGLTHQEAARRLVEFGPNALSARAGPSPLRVFLSQFQSPFIYVMMIAAVISFFVGKRFDPYVILGVLVLNAVIGFTQEWNAARSLDSLRKLTAPKATVLREGRAEVVDAQQVVPGDILLIEAGDRVGADARVLAASELKVDESALTGESEHVEKIHQALDGSEAMALGDRLNMLFMNTIVSQGKGRAVVVATGPATQMGRIAAEVSGIETETPLQRRMADFSRRLGIGILALVASVALLGLFRGMAPQEVSLLALSMAVSALPEGLPIVITVLLAIGVSRMARRNALIRQLSAVEALGGATVICSDKTGTLTRNQMTVRQLWQGGRWLDVTGEGYAPEGSVLLGEEALTLEEAPALRWLAVVARHCNNADLVEEGGEWRIVGDPTEGALLVLAAKLAFDGPWERLEEVPFSSERKWMATLARPLDGPPAVLVKGSPDTLFALATGYLDADGQKRPLDQAARKALVKASEAMAGKALRVLAIAVAEPCEGEGLICHEAIEERLVLVGLVGMKDPPRAEAVKAIQVCQEAGIRVVMITGDHRATAVAIAEQMGILHGDAERCALDGPSLAALSDEELEERAGEVTVYARVDPLHKLRIVRALKSRHEIVAMTGDGVNDAPALATADIGIAMGRGGTEVAKEASAMVLADDNFATIQAAVEEGRVIADNLRKVMRYLLTTSAAEIITISLAIVLGLPLPFLAVQILWINLVTDGLLDKTLAMEKGEPGIMARAPRRPDAPVVDGAMARGLLFDAGLITAGCLSVFAWELGQGQSEAHARTMIFTTMVAFQWFNAFALRSAEVSLFQLGLRHNPWMLLALAIGLGLQLFALYGPPMQALFQTVPLEPFELGLALAVASVLLWVSEFAKLRAHFARRRRGVPLLQ